MRKLYRVHKGQFRGGFVVEDGRVTIAASFLYKATYGKTEKQALANVAEQFTGANIEMFYVEDDGEVDEQDS